MNNQSPPTELSDLPATTSAAPRLWRSVDEYADTEEFRNYLHREFPERAPEWLDPASRRTFLKLMSASLALAGVGVAGCDVAAVPTEKILPYVHQPENVVQGKALQYATAVSLNGHGVGVLVTSQMGRPTTLEGNEKHPDSLGSIDYFSQAAPLGLYDPDRSQVVLKRSKRSREQIDGFETFLLEAISALDALRPKKGAGLRVLTGTVTSPSLARQVRAMLAEFPEAKWHQYDPAGPHTAKAGARLALGRDVSTRYDLAKADVIVALDADFLGFGMPGSLAMARAFAGRREPENGPMNRLYSVEPTLTVTGSSADHRLPLSTLDVAGFAWYLASAVGVTVPSPPKFEAGSPGAAFFDALVADLKAHKGRGLVIAGDAQPSYVHALTHAVNHALGNVGATVSYAEPVEAEPVDQVASISDLAAAMAGSQVDVLLILGGNPVYDAPMDVKFGEGLSQVKFTARLGAYDDETSRLCLWHIPESHEFECWGDVLGSDGTATIQQPLIAPLYGTTRSAIELIAALLRHPDRTSAEIVRATWKERTPEGQDFETFWKTSIHDGVVAGTKAKAVTVKPKDDLGRPPGARTAEQVKSDDAAEEAERKRVEEQLEALRQTQAEAEAREKNHDKSAPKTKGGISAGGAVSASYEAPESKAFRGLRGVLPTPASASDAGLEITFRPDSTIFDGRFANSGWLQELPKPITKLAWDNVAFVSEATAKALKVSGGIGGEGKEADVVRLTYGGRTLDVPVWVMPGQADGTVTLTLGYGRTHSGRVGTDVGYNAYRLRRVDAMGFGRGLKLERLPELGTKKIACTQVHRALEADRALVRYGTLETYQKDKEFAHHKPFTEEHAKAELGPLTMYVDDHPKPPPGEPNHQWGMVVNLNACTGCSACVLSCVAENNTPVVGKEQVLAGREMHWMEIDRYFSGEPEDPEVHHQPRLCMHCENAPCELVCPVEATVHDSEGLNLMVYNRCVGTRYCSNNCPYKVRHFNFLHYSPKLADPRTSTLALLANPDVSVRARGVMEKCTYCVQRINESRYAAELEGRPMKDGDVVTACQAACPTQAITFGDISDPDSAVSKKKADPRNYAMLGELNTRPRTTYLAKITNPNPALAPKPTEGAAHGN